MAQVQHLGTPNRNVQTHGKVTATELKEAWTRSMGSNSEPPCAAREANDVGFLCHGSQAIVIPWTGNDFYEVKGSQGHCVADPDCFAHDGHVHHVCGVAKYVQRAFLLYSRDFTLWK